jgi:hypothetical protein
VIVERELVDAVPAVEVCAARRLDDSVTSREVVVTVVAEGVDDRRHAVAHDHVIAATSAVDGDTAGLRIRDGVRAEESVARDDCRRHVVAHGVVRALVIDDDPVAIPARRRAAVEDQVRGDRVGVVRSERERVVVVVTVERHLVRERRERVIHRRDVHGVITVAAVDRDV